jgi:alpha-glucoside transport system substrate-binding protein
MNREQSNRCNIDLYRYRRAPTTFQIGRIDLMPSKTVFGVPATASLLLLLPAAALADNHLIFPIGEGPFDWAGFEAFAAENDFTGETLTMTGVGTGEDAERLRNLYAYFAEATGATVSYTGSDSFEQDIVISFGAGSMPNIAMFPQPGLARDLAGRGALVPLDDASRQWMTDSFAAGQSWAELATFAGPDGEPQLFGIFYGTDVKSLVWYSPEQFEEAGYEVPETMEALHALSEQIVADGGTPWCLGLGAGAGTGWPATDWVEDMMLRTQPTEVYDQWVANEIPFDDPRVVDAIEEFGRFARNDAYIDGGASAAATIDFRDSPDGLFDFPPKCYLHKQASFIPNFFPEDVEMGVDVDFFYFPAFDSKPELGKPLLGSGGLVSITEDTPAARGFIDFLKTPIAHELMMAQGQFLSPHVDASTETYANDTQRAQGEILTSATTFRFDGSDLMPGEIGTSAFWTGMVDYAAYQIEGTRAGGAAHRIGTASPPPLATSHVARMAPSPATTITGTSRTSIWCARATSTSTDSRRRGRGSCPTGGGSIRRGWISTTGSRTRSWRGASSPRSRSTTGTCPRRSPTSAAGQTGHGGALRRADGHGDWPDRRPARRGRDDQRAVVRRLAEPLSGRACARPARHPRGVPGDAPCAARTCARPRGDPLPAVRGSTPGSC